MLSLTDSRRSFLFTLFRCHKTKRLLAVGNVHLSFDFFKRMDLISLEVITYRKLKLVNNFIRLEKVMFKKNMDDTCCEIAGKAQPLKMLCVI